MRNLLSLSIALGCALYTLTAAGDETPTTAPVRQPPKYYPVPVPRYAPTPYQVAPQPAPYSPSYSPASPYYYSPAPVDEIDHLSQAARHLQAAGLEDEAADIRQRIEVARKKRQIAQRQKQQAAKAELLSKKLAELEALTDEVEQLKKAAGSPQQVMIDIKVLKTNPAKWRALGFDFKPLGDKDQQTCVACGYDCPCDDCQCDAKGPSSVANLQADNKRVLCEFLELARKHGLVELVADPRIVTVSGRPASFHEGGEVPVAKATDQRLAAIQFMRTGTSVDFEPVVLENGKIRCKLQATIRKRAGTDENGAPRISQCRIESLVEVPPGETLVLRGLTFGEAKAQCEPAVACAAGTCQGETELIVLVTPTLISARPAAPPKIVPSPYRSAVVPD